jgi:hypothetical protein
MNPFSGINESALLISDCHPVKDRRHFLLHGHTFPYRMGGDGKGGSSIGTKA